jgi:hypothetical protein
MTNLTVQVNDAQVERAAKLAEVMTADPDMGEPWTVGDVLAMALMHGLQFMEELHIKGGSS